MKLSGRPGKAKLHFEPAEVELLGVLFAELDDVVDSHDGSDIAERLYPAALPDDEAASEQFRGLTEDALQTGRHERIAACRADLEQLPIQLAEGDTGRRWLQVLNDLRLVLGTRLGVTEDGVPEPLDTDDESLAPLAVYDYLTGVQDLLVRALMR